MKKKFKIVKIISGGQTGVDRAGLDVAIDLNIPHGGWCPKGRRAEDGIIPAKYDLIETASCTYARRTEQNVIDSSATIIFSYGPPHRGSKATAEFARKHSKPYRIIDLNNDDFQIVKELQCWLISLNNDNIILNIAGSRESEAPGIKQRVYTIMYRVLFSC